MDPIQFITELGEFKTAVAQTQATVERDNIAERIWQHDHTVWKPDPAEITNRLGWLHLPQTMQPELERINAFVQQVKADGFSHVLLLGMGGSSLAPEMFARTFTQADGLQLAVVDSTDPDAILAFAQTFPLAKTLFIVSTKSGGTVETLSAFKYFYNCVSELSGAKNAGAQFVAITDPGSKLQTLAAQFNFRDTFLNDPNIGGRYSVLSLFGLVPAALVGVDIAHLLARAAAAAQFQEAVKLGVIIGTLAQYGRNKLTLVLSPEISSLADWIEQLVAESTGKEGKGIVPVVGELLAGPEAYSHDRLFVYIHLPHSTAASSQLITLEHAGHPAVGIGLNDLYDLGGQFMMWEMATAVAGHLLNIQPFDQPNVEAAKILARQMVATYHETGQLPAGESVEGTADNLQTFLSQTKPGDYVSLQAYVQPTPETDAALQTLRTHIRDRYKVATTVGYGPRFLHSTGQLHKGDDGRGLFIQFTSDPAQDVPIPDEAGQPQSAMSFGVLKMAQALGDGQALLDGNRRFFRFHLGADVPGGLATLLFRR
ncbi:MAG: glucose-6-phosphate isomerase [Chloroflexi bacterium]|nr:glucose-6-phosphate isomerase [Chloroflexota bacterium]